ncbi:hypothetical protein I8748_11185 [Nostoc sp. CENA67]|uniref:Uncharacterized protein n=1 Tax=Amazonocrinis nigriterrae CENA67 TaxID=2794033 RepID=A0A8J7HN59_9NOST|nr:hypothetical protein [Amazonocrinis nigriterrae]MBH8562736.1 hypothetical protein [Amazonocrinis nigriterrae CENA67]
MSKEVAKVILWEENQKDFLKKFYDLQFVPRIGEEIYIKKDKWRVTKVEHDLEVNEVNVYIELLKKVKQDKSSQDKSSNS